MKRIAVAMLALILLCTAAFAEESVSDRGYSIQLPDGWAMVSNENIGILEEKLGLERMELLAQLGIDENYLNDENRANDMYLNFEDVAGAGNFIVRRISDEMKESCVNLEGYVAVAQSELVPYYASYGATFTIEPQVMRVGDRDWAALEIELLGRNMSQWLTIDEASGNWFNCTFTRVDDSVRDQVLESLLVA